MTGMSMAYHELTSYAPDRHGLVPVDDPRVRLEFLPLQRDRQPAPAKLYPPEFPRIPLPECQPTSTVDDVGLDLYLIALLLRNSVGVVRYRELPDGGRKWFRAASSAGDRQPLESYVVARGIAGLPNGVWHFDPFDNALSLVGRAPAVPVSLIVLTGVPWRTCWRYAERGYRHLWWDAGTALAQLLAVGDEAGLAVRIVLGFQDAQLAVVVGAEPERELPLVAVALGGSAAAGELAQVVPNQAHGGDLGPYEGFDLVTRTHHAGSLFTADAVRTWARPTPRRPSPEPTDAPPGGLRRAGPAIDRVVDLVMRRRSVSRFDTSAGIRMDALRAVLFRCTRPIAWDGGPDTTDLRLLVQRVDGVPMGWYAWADGELCAIGPGLDRLAARRLCREQDIGGDAAALLVLSTDLAATVARRGERGYRAAQLAAGIQVGHVYLAATELGIGCRAVTFDDTLLADLLPPGHCGLLMAAVGMPARQVPAGSGAG
jgi:SagB-type dehydrogenase family enzyme